MAIDRKISSYWFGMPVAVLLLGLLSVILLDLMKDVNERQRTNFALANAIMDLQIKTASAHLWLEEALVEDLTSNAEMARANLADAARLSQAIIRGGKSEYGFEMQPIRDPTLATQAEKVVALLSEFRALAEQRLSLGKEAAYGTALDERFDRIFVNLQESARTLEHSVERRQVSDYGKTKKLILTIVFTWPLIIIATTAALRTLESRRRRAEAALLTANEQLRSQTVELTEHREHLSELVERRTAELMTANEILRDEIAERRKAAEALKEKGERIRQLSSRLINAQEIERKRISMELHDELGQALTAMKFRTRVIEKGLGEDQRATREACEELMEQMDQLIEEVRRLSLALSPTVLEDLGLTSALRWLVGNITPNPAVKVTSDIDEIDHLLPVNHWITIYRVFQEALTNTARHAEAENVSVVVRRQDEAVTFSIEDDGKGFDFKEALMKDATEGGLGLTTMAERMRMMGGVLDLWSQEGKGTRVTFAVPAGKGGA